jgi:hypothetical protein
MRLGDVFGKCAGEKSWMKDSLQGPEGRKPLGRLGNTKNRSRTGPESVEWTDLAQDGDKCWALVNTETNFWSHKMLTILEQMTHYQVFQKASVHTVS